VTQSSFRHVSAPDRWRAYSLQLHVRACVGEVTVAEYLQAIDEPQHLELSVRFSERQVR